MIILCFILVYFIMIGCHIHFLQGKVGPELVTDRRRLILAFVFGDDDDDDVISCSFRTDS